MVRWVGERVRAFERETWQASPPRWRPTPPPGSRPSRSAPHKVLSTSKQTACHVWMEEEERRVGRHKGWGGGTSAHVAHCLKSRRLAARSRPACFLPAAAFLPMHDVRRVPTLAREQLAAQANISFLSPPSSIPSAHCAPPSPLASPPHRSLTCALRQYSSTSALASVLGSPGWLGVSCKWGFWFR